MSTARRFNMFFAWLMEAARIKNWKVREGVRGKGISKPLFYGLGPKDYL